MSIPRSFVPAGMSVLIGHGDRTENFGARSLADGPASSALIAAVAVAVLLGTVRRTGTRVGSLTTSPPLLSRSRKYARTIIVVGVGEGVGVGVGVAGTSVDDGVGVAVGSADGDDVGDAMLAVGVPETAGLGLAAGAPQAAMRARTRSATTD
jgi:hypothetical protein